jgi:hypothetical protein
VDKKTYWNDRLTQSRASLNSVLDQLSPDQWQTKVYGEGQDWTVQDVVAHLVDSENGMSIHIYKIRNGRETVPEEFDLDQWNAGVRQRIGDTSPTELRQRLDAVRQRLLDGLATISDGEWKLTGRHPFRGIISIEQYFETITDHETLHTGHISQAIDRD